MKAYISPVLLEVLSNSRETNKLYESIGKDESYTPPQEIIEETKKNHPGYYSYSKEYEKHLEFCYGGGSLPVKQYRDRFKDEIDKINSNSGFRGLLKKVFG